ncbi:MULTISPECIES: response regulator [Prauserella salsuginis group]|uniref:Response regulator n=1 Tax=Prauserella salsuginis TaxID=387889 RepID=A0ABW6G6Q2_9PSEU|nr:MULTISPECIES: response regulator transcription factor [Prauserella salsuginis group]MCR3722729.1 two component transcriptional regulator, LuxR family [Prauserella flava]MCR3737216.1 two component transcriptional regulator, LuxR family [Prauserella salsuginis]
MIGVCVVDDQTLVRQGIRSLLGLADDVAVVAEASDGDEALDVLVREPPDVLLLDLRMPRRDGIATLEAMRRHGIDVPALILTTFDDDELVLKALRAGARGYLLKDVTLDRLVHAIRTLAGGGSLVQPALTERLVRAVEASGEVPDFADLPAPEPLTERELEILRLLAGGFNNREIADAAGLAEGTVKNHVSNVLMKLYVRDRTRAVLRALDLGLLTGGDG